MAIIGRIPGSAHFRNKKRHKVLTYPCLLAIRIDEGLHFANIEAVNDFIEQAVLEHPDAQQLLLVCSAVNVLDGDGIELLLDWNERLSEQGKTLNLAEVKGPIIDKLHKVNFNEKLISGQIFLSTHEAFMALADGNLD